MCTWFIIYLFNYFHTSFIILISGIQVTVVAGVVDAVHSQVLLPATVTSGTEHVTDWFKWDPCFSLLSGQIMFSLNEL